MKAKKIFSYFHFSIFQGAGFDPKYAQTVGIAVDHRRTNKSEESLKLNIQRLQEYKARLVVVKKGKTTDVAQLHGTIVPATAKANAVSFLPTSEVAALQSTKAYATLRTARTDARLVGIRLKQSKVEKEEKKTADE